MLGKRQTNEMADLLRRIKDLERQVEMLPSRLPPIPTIPVVLQIAQGNKVYNFTSYDDIYGIKIPSTPTTTLPAGSPNPLSTDTYPDGVGVAYKYDENGFYAAVWVVIKATVDSVLTQDTVATLCEQQTVISRRRIKLPKTGGGTDVAYLPWVI